MKGFFRKRVVDPLIALLKQGLSPEKLALSVGFGIMIGVFPMLGSTTFLCLLIGFLLRLNQPSLQIVNHCMYPLQILLLLPFLQLGNRLFQVPPIPLSLSQITVMLQADVWGTIRAFWSTTLRGIVIWFLAAPIVISAIYFALTPVFRKLARIYAGRRVIADAADAKVGATLVGARLEE